MEVIEHQLAHAVPDSLGSAYHRTKFIRERREMMQEWADYLERIKAGVEAINVSRQLFACAVAPLAGVGLRHVRLYSDHRAIDARAPP